MTHHMSALCLCGRYVHEDIMTHQMSTLCLCGRYVHEDIMTLKMSCCRSLPQDYGKRMLCHKGIMPLTLKQ